MICSELQNKVVQGADRFPTHFTLTTANHHRYYYQRQSMAPKPIKIDLESIQVSQECSESIVEISIEEFDDYLSTYADP